MSPKQSHSHNSLHLKFEMKLFLHCILDHKHYFKNMHQQPSRLHILTYFKVYKETPLHHLGTNSQTLQEHTQISH